MNLKACNSKNSYHLLCKRWLYQRVIISFKFTTLYYQY
jgi:hypothetical protein